MDREDTTKYAQTLLDATAMKGTLATLFTALQNSPFGAMLIDAVATRLHQVIDELAQKMKHSQQQPNN